MTPDDDMEFFRLINEVIDPCEEIRMEIRATMANTFGDTEGEDV